MKITTTLFNKEPQEHLLESSTATIGRSSQCEVVINHESMSRKHCLVEVEDGKIYITDLGSTNGVSIDGKRITPHEKTFYLNSLPLVVGAATINIEINEEYTTAPATPVKKMSATASHKTATKELTREKTISLELETRQTKSHKKIKIPKVRDDSQKKKETLIVGAVAIIIILVVLYYFSQT